MISFEYIKKMNVSLTKSSTTQKMPFQFKIRDNTIYMGNILDNDKVQIWNNTQVCEDDEEDDLFDKKHELIDNVVSMASNEILEYIIFKYGINKAIQEYKDDFSFDGFDDKFVGKLVYNIIYNNIEVVPE